MTTPSASKPRTRKNGAKAKTAKLFAGMTEAQIAALLKAQQDAIDDEARKRNDNRILALIQHILSIISGVSDVVLETLTDAKVALALHGEDVVIHGYIGQISGTATVSNISVGLRDAQGQPLPQDGGRASTWVRVVNWGVNVADARAYFGANEEGRFQKGCAPFINAVGTVTVGETWGEDMDRNDVELTIDSKRGHGIDIAQSQPAGKLGCLGFNRAGQENKVQSNRYDSSIYDGTDEAETLGLISDAVTDQEQEDHDIRDEMEDIRPWWKLW